MIVVCVFDEENYPKYKCWDNKVTDALAQDHAQAVAANEITCKISPWQSEPCTLNKKKENLTRQK